MNGRNGEQAKSSNNTDAKPFTIGYLAPPVPQDPVVRTALDAQEYNMARKRRGKCVIFNYKHFDHTYLNERTGTDFDAESFMSCFQGLGFEPIIYTDLSQIDTKKKLNELGEGDYLEDDCFVCCFLTHGCENMLCTKDGKIPVDSIMAPFRGDICPSLAGKPKLFFIQACHGDWRDLGTRTVTTDATDAPKRVCRIPTHADFLAVYSSVPGYYSWRKERCGSWFIQGLCLVLQQKAQSSDLLSMLTVVCRLMTLCYQSYVPDDPSKHPKKKLPIITYSLMRRVNFRQ